MRPLLPVLILLLSAPGAAQPLRGPLRDRVEAIDRTAATPAQCEAQVARAAALNGPDLFYAAAICAAADRPVEASFLLNAGQARSIADMTLIVPATSADSGKIADLYRFIYFAAGGAGSDEVLRDPALRERLFRLFDGWSPAFDAAYDPGWNARRRPAADAYRAAVAEIKAGRRRQLADYVRLLSDDVYYALHTRMQALHARTSGRYVEGTADADLSLDLQRRMDERAVALGVREARSPAAEPGTQREPSFPPASPAPDEVVQTAAADPAADRCADMAERITIAEDSQIARVLVTTSPEWETIWRADITGGRNPGTRFTCSARASSSTPLGQGPEAIPPLPAGGGAPPARP